jgi:hypothetical protein
MRTTLRAAAVAAATLPLLLASGERASAQVELSLYGAVYTPLTDVAATEGSSITGAPQQFGWRLTTSSAVGGRLTLWLSRRLGVEAAALFSPSDLAIDNLVPMWPPVEFDASVVIASGRVIWRAVGPDRPVTYHLLGGIGFVTRSGLAFETIEGTTDPAAVLGGGLRARLGPRVDLRLDVEDYAYFAELVVVELLPDPNFSIVQFKGNLGTRFVNDLVFSLGLSLEL